MAMNKKEKEAFDELRREALLNKSLRWTDGDSSPDLPRPSNFDSYVNGWSINSYRGAVYESWSSPGSHGDGRVVDGIRPKSASQQGIAQYSTKEKALIALRRKLENSFASQLADIDMQISELKNTAA
jgi:hypothetical protein